MPNFSNSPLGLGLSSDLNASVNRVGSYVTSSVVESLFTQGNYPVRFGIPTRIGDPTSDISTTRIIDDLSKYEAMKLKYSDFAYLKNLGVYPNNRLMIARRFSSPVDDDLTVIKKTPTSTLISWVPDNEEFIKATEFGEEWEQGEASFKRILNDIGGDILGGDNKTKQLGDFIGGGAGVVPLPGFTEGLQWQIFNSLGMTELDASNFPMGNPNIIKESMKRKQYEKDQASSGLSCKFSIKMTVEYEQKFINGIDPTIVYYDIIANALTFGTSESQFLFKRNTSDKFKEFLDNLSSGDGTRIKKALVDFITALGDAVAKVATAILSFYDKTNASNNSSVETNQSEQDRKDKERKEQSDRISQGRSDLSKKLDEMKALVFKLLQGLVNKYKIRIISVVNALTGTPSAPWHITVGDPRFPIFCSGDMLVRRVSISMGKLLAFNNLPASIKLEFTLESARNLGAQEIYNKFSTGQGRTYVKYDKSFVETDTIITPEETSKSKSNMAINQLKNGAKVNVTNGRFSQSDADKVGNDLFPKGITQISGVAFNANGNGSVFAKANVFLRDKAGTIIKPSTPISFESDGRVYDYTNQTAPKLIGSYIINENGGVSIKSTDPRFQNEMKFDPKN